MAKSGAIRSKRVAANSSIKKPAATRIVVKSASTGKFKALKQNGAFKSVNTER